MTEKNNKVPIAILSCFLIAFILQGVLKLSGILVFEKALDWEIFTIIDTHKWIPIIYYSLIVFINMYCLSFALTSKPYSKKWYHYVIMLIVAFGNTIIKLNYTLTNQQHILFDVLMYIVVPLIVNFTTSTKDKLFKNDLFNIILTITIQISLYFGFIGLGYWSNLLNSLLPISPVVLSASTNFLIRLEVYIGLAMFMLSMNMLIQSIKRRFDMNIPIDIATEEAKVKELQEKKAKKNSKKNGK